MKYIAGIDVGNSTTEVALAEISEDNAVKFLSSAFVLTTGIKEPCKINTEYSELCKKY